MRSDEHFTDRQIGLTLWRHCHRCEMQTRHRIRGRSEIVCLSCERQRDLQGRVEARQKQRQEQQQRQQRKLFGPPD